MKKIAVIALVSIIAFLGCSTKDNPVETSIPTGTMVRAFVNAPSLEGNIIGESVGRPVFVYEPPEYQITSVDSFEVYIDTTIGGEHIDTTYIYYIVTSTDYPILFLLHGYGGNYAYYSDLFILKEILDEMIYSGEIDPMIVVTPDCNNQFGGSFYTNSPEINTVDDLGNPIVASFGGAFEDFMVTDLIDYMNERFSVDTVATKRGISGHSMGGYGAMKLALKYPELFGSVSAMSAPLAFPALEGLLPTLLAENDFTPGDTAAFYGIEPAPSKRITSMWFAMGAAFTPHDHFNPDTTYFHRLSDVPIFVGVDLPIGIDGQLAATEPVWLTWLEHDPLTMLTTGGYADAFANANTAVYIDCGLNDDLGFNYHAEAFSGALSEIGIPHTYTPYSGYSESDANHSKYIADRIREILKFHNEVFNQTD